MHPYSQQPPQSILAILYQDAHLVIVNKPPGIVCHPVAGHQGDTLLSRLRFYFGEQTRLVHRIDQQTSGIVLAVHDPDVMNKVSRQFEKRTVKKTYLALVYGKMEAAEGSITLPLFVEQVPGSLIKMKVQVRPDGIPSQTDYKVLQATDTFSLVEAIPHTGRKHQIRVHFAALGHPVIGDALYTRGGLPFLWNYFSHRDSPWPSPLQGHGLHAYKLEILHPVTQQSIQVTASLPQDWQEYLQRANSTN